ncbi:hypothetical protein HELRODRAFT_158787 [Helobdella robusta]|uniref:Uncharacterized protein n=1 Tax=Helobdella robusta TaxID=6412 RepID=T1EN95_HELRO|nr:hypothetical protein HELRODRAFT_158787 [Helobdella robusta]ESO12302.1 hypothetical protein HELRODRAFT_158787 [Helobdella robusta]
MAGSTPNDISQIMPVPPYHAPTSEQSFQKNASSSNNRVGSNDNDFKCQMMDEDSKENEEEDEIITWEDDDEIDKNASKFVKRFQERVHEIWMKFRRAVLLCFYIFSYFGFLSFFICAMHHQSRDEGLSASY